MEARTKPIIIVSECLGFAKCRYNGLVISDEFVQSLEPYVTFIPVCPEVEIGLGVPRNPVRVVSSGDTLRLMQPATNNDVTEKMNAFCKSFLESVSEVDGFILKSRSPSCGIKDVKIYKSIEKGSAIGKGVGFFGDAVISRFGFLPIEEEGRLTNLKLREHFLIRCFMLCRWREVKKSVAMRQVVRFHTENKLLLMAYSQKELRIMGKIVANPQKKPVREVIEDYEQHLLLALSRMPKYTSYINVMMHVLGFFSEGLSHEEKAFFLDALEKYRAGKSTLSSDIILLKSWIVRFREPYLNTQTFFDPYPEGLFELTDSGKGRNLSQ